MNQQSLMKFDPATGEPSPYPSHAEQWRLWHGIKTAWLFNPWTGNRRSAQDVGSDPVGILILEERSNKLGAYRNNSLTGGGTMTHFTQEQAVEMVVQIGADEKDCPWAILTPEELTALVNLAADRAIENRVMQEQEQEREQEGDESFITTEAIFGPCRTLRKL